MTDDPGRPWANPRWEVYTQAVFGGKTQYAAYLEAYPKSKGWKRASVDTKASLLMAKIQIRLEWLQKQSASKAVISVTRRMEMLSKAAEDCFKGLGQFARAKDGNVVFKVTEENRGSLALKDITQRIEKARKKAEEDGDEELADILQISARDFLPYIQELNKMEGQYAPEKHQVDHEFNFISAIPEPNPRPKGLRRGEEKEKGEGKRKRKNAQH